LTGVCHPAPLQRINRRQVLCQLFTLRRIYADSHRHRQLPKRRRSTSVRLSSVCVLSIASCEMLSTGSMNSVSPLARQGWRRTKVITSATWQSSGPCPESVGSTSPHCSPKLPGPSADVIIRGSGHCPASRRLPSAVANRTSSSCAMPHTCGCGTPSIIGARVATQHDPKSRARYAALRQRGHSHGRAIRGVADRLLALACVLLQRQTPFDPHFGQAAAP
jgi:hypothetical protein